MTISDAAGGLLCMRVKHTTLYRNIVKWIMNEMEPDNLRINFWVNTYWYCRCQTVTPTAVGVSLEGIPSHLVMQNPSRDRSLNVMSMIICMSTRWACVGPSAKEANYLESDCAWGILIRLWTPTYRICIDLLVIGGIQIAIGGYCTSIFVNIQSCGLLWEESA